MEHHQNIINTYLAWRLPLREAMLPVISRATYVVKAAFFDNLL